MRNLLLITLWLGFSHSYAYQITPVTVYADDAYPPYSYASDGVAKGIYADVLRVAFSRMPMYDVSIAPVPFKRGLRMLETGKGFALYPPYFYPNQRKYIEPYSVPILNEEVVVYCNPDIILISQPRTVWPDDYFGLTIGINDSFAIGGDLFWQASRQGKLTVETAIDNRENILKLRAKRIDCYINDKLSILWEVKQLKKKGAIPENTQFRLGVRVSKEQGYLAFSGIEVDNFPYKADFIKRFNQIINEMRDNGQIENIIKQYTD
ncbi:transporter substrate-binding domain-containing protein [Vibrio sp. T187]|uniref:substrate-binding periplasmic protein n=1 Tax=Vibrio TaxID=662 RepID=UPI0010C96FB1|nr:MULTISPECIES: transporter substrate-binding domain-containing protein [Vibrio]MBW3696184.1 transporter substrate-binding domain-containing protein [Vibrio sp. T187]